MKSVTKTILLQNDIENSSVFKKITNKNKEN